MVKGNRRIALYSHDTQGLGHIRRNLAIATALSQAEPRSNILLIAGAREAGALNLPPGVDCLTLPSLAKDETGHYHTRSLSIPLQKLIILRTKIIQAALTSFAPDVLIVDKVPLGAFGELKPGLEYLYHRRQTRLILGLRDVLDDPDTVRHEWLQGGYEGAIQTFYDAIWIYGDPKVYDPVREYRFSGKTTGKVQYTGYLDRQSLGVVNQTLSLDLLASLRLPPGRLALCLVGGGQDGYRLARTFLEARLPAGTNGLVLTGPFMPVQVRFRLCQAMADRPRQGLLTFIPDPESLLNRADCVVTMGGYNSVCEILSFRKRALIVPRLRPRREQFIRAKRLSELGLVDFLHPADLDPRRLSTWLAQDSGPKSVAATVIDFNGLERIPALLNDILAAPPDHGVVRRSFSAAGRSSPALAWTLPAPTQAEEVHRVLP